MGMDKKAIMQTNSHQINDYDAVLDAKFGKPGTAERHAAEVEAARLYGASLHGAHSGQHLLATNLRTNDMDTSIHNFILSRHPLLSGAASILDIAGDDLSFAIRYMRGDDHSDLLGDYKAVQEDMRRALQSL